jgi:hypothetical protein
MTHDLPTTHGCPSPHGTHGTHGTHVPSLVPPQVLIKLVSPYKRVTLSFVAQHINVTKDEVEAILVELILDHRVAGKVGEKRRRERNEEKWGERERDELREIREKKGGKGKRKP